MSPRLYVAIEMAMELATDLHGEAQVAATANNLHVAYTEAGDFVTAESLHMQRSGDS